MSSYTAYSLYRKAYLKYMGRWMGRRYNGTSPKPYILQVFEDDLGGYTINIEENCSVIILDYEDANKYQSNLELLQGIELPSGYYLCLHSGHTGSWHMFFCASRVEARATYRNLYQRYFRHETFICTIKV